MTLEYQVAPMPTTVPHNREAEEACLGCVLINPSCYYEIARFLRAEDFYVHRNQWIWEAFVKLHKIQKPIDLLTVADVLENTGIDFQEGNRLQEIGGPAYLTSLVNQVPSSLNAETYARMVLDQSERRTAIALANTLAAAAYNEGKDFSMGEHALSISSSARNNSKRIDADEAASQMIDLIQNPSFFTSGISDVDDKIGGLFPAELSILAGYQGTGKSAEKIQGARKNAEQGARVLLCDLEMTAAQTWFRMACGDLGIDMNRVRSGKVSSETQGQIMEYAAKLGDKYKNKIVIYQSPMSPGDILTAAMMEKPDILYVDTLKNISGKPAKDGARDWYDYTLNFLRINVAQATGAHVQVLHHINRSSHRENKKPTMHDLMFAGESDADAVFILYRKPEDYAVNLNKTVIPIVWITDKSRFGWTGEEEVNFKLVNQLFYGMSHRGA